MIQSGFFLSFLSTSSRTNHHHKVVYEPTLTLTTISDRTDKTAKMILVDIISIILRLAELAFATIVAALNGRFLHAARGASSWDLGRHIYTEVVAGLSILFAIIWLFPFSSSFIHWPMDLAISVMWFVSFGLLVNWLNGACGYVFSV